MPKTIGYHLVKTGYGLWLPGDDRGSWSPRWDAEIGLIEPHQLHPGDPVRKRMAAERMKHEPVRITDPMIAAIEHALESCVTQSKGGLNIAAAGLESTHMHLLIPYSGRDIDNTAKWIADQSTKAVHRRTEHDGPLWCKGKWRGFIFERSHWTNTKSYIEQHNTRRGMPAAPYSFISSS